MASLNSYFYILTLFLYTCFSISSADRRFSDLKRCADDECSMLLGRGKAAKDFTGPDCRFLSFKKGETIYMYYKLSGQRSDLWAGSVGNHFGYFPKDYLNINHIYTDKEIEVPAEETDFVCFDTGLDKFESYDVDVLLGNSLLIENEDLKEDSPHNKADASETETESSESTAHLKTLDSESPETVRSESPASPEKDALLLKTIDEESDSLQAKIEEILSEPAFESEDVVQEEPETAAVPLLDEQADISLNNDAVALEDLKTEPSESDVQYDSSKLSNQSVSEKRSDSEDVTDFEPQESLEPEARKEDSEVELVKTDQEKTLQTAEKTLETFEEVTEDKNVGSTLKDGFEGEHKDEKQDTGSPEEVTKDQHEEALPEEPQESHFKDLTSPEKLHKENDSEEQEIADDKLPELSQLQHDTNTPDATGDSNDTQPKSHNIPSEQPVESHESESTSTSLNADRVLTDDDIVKDDTPKVETNKTETTNENTEDLQKVSTNTHENAEPQNSVTNQDDKADDHIKEDDPEKVGANKTTTNENTEDLQKVSTNTNENAEPQNSVTNQDDHIKEDDLEKVDANKTTANENSEDLQKASTNTNEKENIKDDVPQNFVTNQDDKPDDHIKEDDPEKVDANKTTINENTEDLQKVSTDTNINANETIKDSEPQKSFTNKDETADDHIKEEDLEKVDVNKTKTTNENTEDLQKVSMNTNVNANKNIKDDEAQNFVTTKDEKADDHIKKDDPEKVDINKTETTNENTEDLQKASTSTNVNANKNIKDSEPQISVTNQDEKADDHIKEDDPEKLDANKATTNENTEDLQKVSTNTNVNAEPQNSVTNEDETADDHINEDDPEMSIINENIDLHESEEAEVLENPETVDNTDDQINKVRNELTDLLRNTLESEKRSPEDEPQDQDEKEDPEELLEDENALFSLKPEEDTHDAEENQQPEIQYESDQSDNNTEPEEVPSSSFTNVTQTEDEDGSEDNQKVSSEEPEYSDSILRLTILRDHVNDEDMERIQKFLGLKNLFKLEAMFSDLDQELMSVKMSETRTENIENTLDQIMEASENSILDVTEEMLNERERIAQEHGLEKETDVFDLDATILDAFQEIVFSLRQKYSTASESVPLLEEEQFVSQTEEQYDAEEEKDAVSDAETIKPLESLEIQEEENESEIILNSELNVNTQDVSPAQDLDLEEDGGHFNKNKDAQIGFEEAEEIQIGPHAILEKPGFHFEVDPSSDSLETPSVSDFHDAETNTDISSSTTSDELWSLLLPVKEYLGVYAEILIAALPEEWRPGPTFHGVPWEPVMVTAAVGFLTVLMFFWRTLLAIKGRTYQLTEKQLKEKIQQLLSEKSDAAEKISKLNEVIKEREEQFKNSEKNLGSSQQEMKQLKTHHQKLQSQCEEMSKSVSQLNQKIIDTQEENSNLNEKILKMHQRIEQYQKTLKNFDEERAKVHVLVDEAKLREDALKAQMNCFEKENGALKEQKKSLLRDVKDWQEKHEKLGEKIRVFHKSQKELEDSLMHKENEIEVLSSCIAELNRLGACDAAELQKDDAKMSHGEDGEKKIDTMRMRIKQMMDVSRIKATLSVIEDERNRYMESLLNEQRSRQELEEQYQKVMHDQMHLNNEKTHLENQFKILQQRLEITTELYQQKENALQQKLTKEELERHEKETKLSEVDGKAVRSEEELRVLKQKIREIEEEMQQNEQTLKNEVAVQEKKAHENWLKARASERALVEERREAATLRQKLVECSDKISDLEQTLFKLNSAPPDRHARPMRRGPRPPSDPHGRFSDLGHPLPSRPEMFPPMTSSPCAHDGPMQTAPVPEATEVSEQITSEPVESLSKSQGQGSFLPSPIRDSPVPPLNAPLKSYGPPIMGGPVPPNGPPHLMIRPPNGHPPMMPPGPSLGPDPRFRPPPLDSYGPPPPIGPFGPVPPPFARGPMMRDLPPMGPLPPPRDIPPEFFGPRGLPPRGFSSGPLPPFGAMVPPPYASRGFPGPVPRTSSRDNEENVTSANNPPTDGSSQRDTGDSSLAEP
nr:transport and Golgi organization protein 1 homolog isoform X4 [Misgurnus anguillicaudatus]